MIVAERKPFDEICRSIEGAARVLIVGCGTCVAVCMSGGEKEVELLSQEIRMHLRLMGKDVVVDGVTITRQCDKEFITPIVERFGRYDILLSTACGAGVQLLAEIAESKITVPALNTRFIGTAEGSGAWTERCSACADCMLSETGGICPVTMCAKSLLNGPCGGTNHGKCETDETRDCAWALIFERMRKQGRLDELKKIRPPKDYKVKSHPARFVHAAFAEEKNEGEQ